MANNKPKPKKNGKTNIGIVPVVIGARALERANIQYAINYAKQGDYGGALTRLGSVTDAELQATMVDGIKYKLVKGVTGRLPLIQTKKFSLSVM